MRVRRVLLPRLEGVQARKEKSTLNDGALPHHVGRELRKARNSLYEHGSQCTGGKIDGQCTLLHSDDVTSMKYLLVASLFIWSGNVFAQSTDAEPAAVLELGAAASWSLHDDGSSFGPDIAVEVTPIENWLELEASTSPLFTRHSTEWDTDLLFKKPWTLSKRVEFMSGVGPEWIHTKAYGVANKHSRGRSRA
jgi:hypothetical protein